MLWKIDKIVTSGKYKYAIIPEHPNKNENNYVLLHRVIMENSIGRLLNENEVVHHIDNNGLNNELSNLQLMSKEKHNKLHRDEKYSLYFKICCPNCNNIFIKRIDSSFLFSNRKYTCCSKKCSKEFENYILSKGGIDDYLYNKIINSILGYCRYDGSYTTFENEIEKYLNNVELQFKLKS